MSYDSSVCRWNTQLVTSMERPWCTGQYGTILVRSVSCTSLGPRWTPTTTVERQWSDSGATSAHWAARFNFEVLRVLHELGVPLDTRANDGATLAHWAARSNSEALGILHKLGVPLDARDNGGATPAHWAARHSPGALCVLHKLGVPLDARDNADLTPVHWADKFCMESSKLLHQLGSPDRGKK